MHTLPSTIHDQDEHVNVSTLKREQLIWWIFHLPQLVTKMSMSTCLPWKENKHIYDESFTFHHSWPRWACQRVYLEKTTYVVNLPPSTTCDQDEHVNVSTLKREQFIWWIFTFHRSWPRWACQRVYLEKRTTLYDESSPSTARDKMSMSTCLPWNENNLYDESFIFNRS